jgi:hypothetical protein
VVLLITAQRRCRGCGALIASTSRRDRRYCSASCRVTAYRQRQAQPGMTASELDRLVATLDAPRAEAMLLAGVAVAAREDWKAAAWILQRRFPTRWDATSRGVTPLAADESNDEFDWSPDVS